MWEVAMKCLEELYGQIGDRSQPRDERWQEATTLRLKRQMEKALKPRKQDCTVGAGNKIGSCLVGPGNTEGGVVWWELESGRRGSAPGDVAQGRERGRSILASPFLLSQYLSPSCLQCQVLIG